MSIYNVCFSEACLSLTEYLPAVETQKGWRHMNEEIISSWILEYMHTYTKSCIPWLRKHFKPVPYAYMHSTTDTHILKYEDMKREMTQSQCNDENKKLQETFKDLRHHFISLDWTELCWTYWSWPPAQDRRDDTQKTVMLQETDVVIDMVPALWLIHVMWLVTRRGLQMLKTERLNCASGECVNLKTWKRQRTD